MERWMPAAPAPAASPTTSHAPKAARHADRPSPRPRPADDLVRILSAEDRAGVRVALPDDRRPQAAPPELRLRHVRGRRVDAAEDGRPRREDPGRDRDSVDGPP